MYLIDLLYDLLKYNLNQLELTINYLNSNLNKINTKQEIISLFLYLDYFVEQFQKRNKEVLLFLEEKEYKSKFLYLNELTKIENLELINFLNRENFLEIDKNKIFYFFLKNEINKLKKELSEITKKIEIEIKIHKYFLLKIKSLFDLLHNIKFNIIVINKKCNGSLKYKQVFDDFSKVIFDNLEDFKIINNFFIQIEKENSIFIIRKDSLYINLLILEDIILKKDEKYNEKLKSYWENLVSVSESESKELERIYLFEQNKIINYKIFDYYIVFEKEFFLLNYLKKFEIKEIIFN